MYKIAFIEFLHKTGYYKIVSDDLVLSVTDQGVYVHNLDGALDYILSEDFPENIFDYLTLCNGLCDYVEPLSKRWKELLKVGAR